MISAIFVDGQGALHRGSLELIERWSKQSDSFLWLDFEQEVDDAERELLRRFGCHELAVSDAHRPRHPPKVEHFDDQTFILYRGIASISDGLDIEHLQLALFVGERFLVTRHNKPAYSVAHFIAAANIADLVKNPAQLAVNIMHYSSGRYLEQLLAFEAELSDLEDLLQTRPNDDLLKDIIVYRSRLRRLRRVFDYHQKLSSSLMDADTKEFAMADTELVHKVRDLYDRCERLHSLCSMYYEICGDLIEGYLSLSSHQLNNTMRVLTVITAVFVPLGFMAGVYGMNFEVMPELHHPNAYYILLTVMGVTAISLLTVFRKKNWI